MSTQLSVRPSQGDTVRKLTVVAGERNNISKTMKSVYQTEQQVKFLHLQAEVEFLLQQQHTIKQKRLTNPKTKVNC